MTPKLLLRLDLTAALLLVASVVFSATQPPLALCGGLDRRYPPILAFEFARSVADLHALFGPAPGACRSAVVVKLDLINWLDTALFIPIYGAFLAFGVLSLRARHPALARWAVVLTLSACCADYLENACLLQLSAAPDVASGWLALLAWATGVKWVLLGVVGVLASRLVSERRGLTALCVAGLAIVVLALAVPAKFGRFATLGVSVSWLMLLVAVVRVWWLGRRGAAPLPVSSD